MKNKRFLILISTVGILVFGGVTSLAYVNYLGNTKTQVTTGTLNVSLSQNTLAIEQFKDPIMPLDEIKKELYVSTSGTYNQYLRIQCYRSWTSLNDSYQLETDTDASLIELTLAAPNDWLVVGDEDHTGILTLYYKHPVEPNKKITVMNKITIGNIPSESQNTYANLGLQIDAKAEAVQQIGNQDGADTKALQDVWGINATIDESGTIQNIVSK